MFAGLPAPTELHITHRISRDPAGATALLNFQKAGAIPVGAALCRDGPRSGPGNLCCEAENLGPLRAPSRHKAAPTGIAPAQCRQTACRFSSSRRPA
ncbi:protein of unknown function [Pseudomonas sp. JV551A1]|nr:protein of unknown function [Pseudomonas sp. JV551A1]